FRHPLRARDRDVPGLRGGPAARFVATAARCGAGRGTVQGASLAVRAGAEVTHAGFARGAPRLLHPPSALPGTFPRRREKGTRGTALLERREVVSGTGLTKPQSDIRPC